MGKNPLKQLEDYTGKLKAGFQGIQNACAARHAECEEKFEGVALFAEILEEHDRRISDIELLLNSRDDIREILKNLPLEDEKLDMDLINDVMKKE